MVFIPLNHIQPILHHNAMLYLVSDTSALIGIWRTCSVVKFQFSVVYDDVFSVFPIVGMGNFSPSLSILGLVYVSSSSQVLKVLGERLLNKHICFPGG